MIRPITLICWMLALGAGLYLYRAKHEVELMDRHIEVIAKETGDIRAESRHMLDEWIRLGEPEQLRKYSDQYLGLKTIEPPQFVRFADLPARLPAPRADPGDQPGDAVAQSGLPAQSPVAQSTPGPLAGAESAGVQGPIIHPSERVMEQPGPAHPAATATASNTAEAVADDLPVPPIPPATATLAAAAEPAAIAPPLQARPVTPAPRVQPDLNAQRPTATDETRVAAEPRPIAPKPTAVEPRRVAQGQFGGLAPQPRQPPNQDPFSSPGGHPPLQAQARDPGAPRDLVTARDLGPARQEVAARGLPPLQAQMPRDQVTMRPTPVSQEMPAMRPTPVAQELPPLRAPGAGMPPVGPTQMGPTQMGPTQMGPTQGGSLLGSRGAVPIPLPAPTPVSATWTSPGR